MSTIPSHLSSRWLPDDPAAIQTVRESMLRHYYQDPSISAEVIERDITAHLLARLTVNRTRVVPWLDAVRPLAGAEILEIGCGTGASTLALAEQGAKVTGLDILDDSVQVARDRCHAYGAEATFVIRNADALDSLFTPGQFGWIMIYAALEHMTFAERIACLRQAWAILPEGGLLSVIDTPNRLWYRDDHTAQLPFFHWLPDEVAFHYSRFSDRPYFKELYREYSPEKQLHFLRRGRGVSFHEFELAIAPRQQLEVVSCLTRFHRERQPDQLAAWQRSPEATYEASLHRACPDLDRAFLQPDLDLTLRKS
jgi:2-polyprenyl-3-methyl-5-hydroxy-6-metoxy-1,4-benzoquinol methylase